MRSVARRAGMRRFALVTGVWGDSHAYATETLRGVFARLLRGL